MSHYIAKTFIVGCRQHCPNSYAHAKDYLGDRGTSIWTTLHMALKLLLHELGRQFIKPRNGV